MRILLVEGTTETTGGHTYLLKAKGLYVGSSSNGIQNSSTNLDTSLGEGVGVLFRHGEQFMRWNPDFFNQFNYFCGREWGGFIPAW